MHHLDNLGFPSSDKTHKRKRTPFANLSGLLI
jgi:hypothetical protein